MCLFIVSYPSGGLVDYAFTSYASGSCTINQTHSACVAGVCNTNKNNVACLLKGKSVKSESVKDSVKLHPFAF